MTIRVLLADDQPSVRAALRDLLMRADDIDVVGEAADGDETIQVSHRVQPDVILMDIRMPRLDGISATERLVADRIDGAPRVIVLTTFDLDEYVYAALRAGASGFLIKNTPPERLREAVRLVAAGNALLDPAVTLRVIQHFVIRGSQPVSPLVMVLTEREREIAILIARGMSNLEIADSLSISYWTVKTHVKSILAKLHGTGRSQIVIAAYESGLVSRDK
jgi:DNA-binding NarL/FixJ family response regulator